MNIKLNIIINQIKSSISNVVHTQTGQCHGQDDTAHTAVDIHRNHKF